MNLSKEDKMFIKRIFHVNALKILTNEKHFPKTINHEDFDQVLCTKWSRIILAHNFSRSSFKLKKRFYLP